MGYYVNMKQKMRIIQMSRGGSRIFSKGGGNRIFKKFAKILTTFLYRSTKLIFRALPKHFLPLFWRNFVGRRQIFEETVKEAVFLRVFFGGARSPSKLVYIGAQSAFRKILGSLGQKWISEKSIQGSFGSAGGRIPEGRGASAPRLPPKSAPANETCSEFQLYHIVSPFKPSIMIVKYFFLSNINFNN